MLRESTQRGRQQRRFGLYARGSLNSRPSSDEACRWFRPWLAVIHSDSPNPELALVHGVEGCRHARLYLYAIWLPHSLQRPRALNRCRIVRPCGNSEDHRSCSSCPTEMGVPMLTRSVNIGASHECSTTRVLTISTRGRPVAESVRAFAEPRAKQCVFPWETMPTPTIVKVVTISTVSMTMSCFCAQAARFRDVGDLLKSVCSSRYSSSGSVLRWMILFSAIRRFPQTMVAAMKHLECAYEVRTIESLAKWEPPYELPSADYKVIAIGLSIGELRYSLNIYVSL